MPTPPGDEGRVIVYSDYVCPFCHIGREALKRALGEVDDPPPVEWRPFDLRAPKRRPDGTIDETVDVGKDEAYFRRARENVERLRERIGVDMVDLEEVRGVDSWPALQAALRVRDEEPEAFPAFHDGLFEALWVEGRDVGDPSVLRAVAEGAGLDGDAIVDAAADPEAEAALRDALDEAREVGVRAVPTTIIGRRPVQGAAPPDKLLQLLEDL